MEELGRKVVALSEFFGVAAGTTMPGSAGRPAAGTTPTSVTSTSASAS